MNEKVLRRVQRMNDKIKLIFVMRDPVERAWSAVNNAAKKGAADASTVEKARSSARAKSGAVARSAYADTIRRLEAVFPASQIHYCFFDDLRDQPRGADLELALISRRRASSAGSGAIAAGGECGRRVEANSARVLAHDGSATICPWSAISAGVSMDRRIAGGHAMRSC